MIAYHIDRGALLEKNQTVNLNKCSSVFPSIVAEYASQGCPNGVSRFGIDYIHRIVTLPPQGFYKKEHTSAIIERDFEQVRRERYPHIPSRFECVFANESLGDVIRYWGEFFIPGARIWKIETRYKGITFDASFLNCNYNPNVDTLSEAMPYYKDICRYWEQERSPEPRLELLVPLPFFVLEKCSFEIH